MQDLVNIYIWTLAEIVRDVKDQTTKLSIK